MVERLHRLLLDVVKDEFERLGRIDINPVQALLLFNIGDDEVTAGELKTRGYYQGSNVSYNLKKLVEGGYLHHERSPVDRRSVRIRLTAKGRQVRDVVAELFARHSAELLQDAELGVDSLGQVVAGMRRLERYWSDQIRYIY
nr:MarR family transcriptional regulator [Oceanicella actignis]